MIVAVWRDPRTPRVAKLLLALCGAYLLCPLDLVPDFVPVLGQLDDVLIVGLGLWFAWMLVPRELREEHRSRAIAPKALSADDQV